MIRPQLSDNKDTALRQLFGRAVDHHRKGQLAEAERLYFQVLEARPRQAQAQHMLGVLRAQQGRLREAFELVGSAVKADPTCLAAVSDLGLILHKLGRHLEALATFDKVLRIEPAHAAALSNRGNALAKLGRHEEALASYDRALAIRPDHAEALCNRGHVLLMLRRFEEALTTYERALALRPRDADALHGRGSALSGLGRHDEALASFDGALSARPTFAGAHYDRANALAALRRYEEAIAGYDRALAIRPVDADALGNRGSALLELRRYEEALASYDRALAIRPHDAAALNNRGSALLGLRRYEDALASYDRALLIGPHEAGVLNNRGSAFQALHSYEQALSSYDQALAIEPRFVDALYNRANLLKEMKRYDEALLAYEVARGLDPDHADSYGLVPTAQAICAFSRIDHLMPALTEAIEVGKPFTPFALLAVCDDPALHLRCAKKYIGARMGMPPPSRTGAVRHHDKIRIAYLSGDFCQHPVMLLAVGLFEIHDRSRFEVIGVSFGPDDHSQFRQRIIDSFDDFHDVRARSDRDVARLLNDWACDIAIDLTAYTKHSRSEILSLRPAPVQVNYLGYPGTMGADFIDYVIADPITLPFDQQPFYTEKIVHLPHTYQVNDRTRPIAERSELLAVARGSAGLPARGFVFCCFNDSHKITQPVFEVWMRLLNNVPGSVLWLLGSHAAAERNLQREAHDRGIDPARLVFAPRLGLEAHLVRHHIADLFLDTLPYNAHTTASDALWAGLPLVTCQGRAFAGRVAGSLLSAIGLPELVTTTLADYEALAIRLAGDPARLADVREKLARNRQTHPLFDTDRFRRHIEAAYTRMWEISQRGDAPQSFAVEPIG
jgi:protein O-GlcNAc transferase